MTLHTTTGTTPNGHRTSGCGCGCGCESRCCELECLVRPNFFCGQLLTDADLGALVAWSRSRLSLARYREGWGVACGLDVTCSPPDGGGACGGSRDGGPTVWVGPGYAVDCCGNDLVVCEPIEVGLGDVCRPPTDLCGQLEPQRPAPKDGGGAQPPKGERAGPHPEKPPVEPPAPEVAERGASIVVVDLALRYGEDLTRGQRAMFRGSCSDAGPCEYTRVLERPTVVAELGDPERTCAEEDDPVAWRREYQRREQQLGQQLERGGAGLAPLLEYLREHPPYRLCFLGDLARLEGDERAREAVRETIWWLRLDWMLRELACGCPSCRSDQGVPLARVVLRRPAQATQPCRVVLVDPTPPHRRPLHRDRCHPVPPGAIDLAPWVWRPHASAKEELARLGIRVEEPTDVAQAVGAVIRDPVLWADARDPRVRAVSVSRATKPRQVLDCDRIVGFAPLAK